jgi:tripartite-type tricarboxylate transporter receptor subunit TctC
MAPADTPKDVVAKLAAAFKQVLDNPDIRKSMVTQGADPAYLSPDDFGAYLVQQMPVWAKAVKDSGAKLD